MKVVMAESSDIFRDGRVQKEAISLVGAGYVVTVLGFCSTDGAKRDFPFKLIPLPIFSRKRRSFRNISITINIILLNLRVLFMKADIYHAHNTMFLAGMYIASRLYRGKFIYDCHEVQFEAGKMQLLLEKYFIRKADAIINVSEGRAAYQAVQYNLNQDEIVVVHNYPECMKLNTSSKHCEEKPVKRLVFSGGFNLLDNRLDDFIKILAGVPSVEMDFIAFGYGDSGERLKKAIHEFGLEDRVRFLPLVPFNNLLETLSSYDFAVDMLTNPESSLSKRYPAINKTYEYFAAGLPIICSNMEAFLGEVEGQNAGICIDPKDVKCAREKVNGFFADTNRLKVMHETVLRLSKEKYNWHVEEMKLVALYRKLSGCN